MPVRGTGQVQYYVGLFRSSEPLHTLPDKVLPVLAREIMGSWYAIFLNVEIYCVITTALWSRDGSAVVSLLSCCGISTPVSFAMHLFNPLGVRSYRESRAVL